MSCRLPDERGVLIGALFERRGDLTERLGRAALPPDDSTKRTDRREPRPLADGTHVGQLRRAVAETRPASRAWVSKDPTGSLPCFSTTFQGVHVIFGNIADLVDTQLFKFTINERYLRDRVLHGGILDQPCAE